MRKRGREMLQTERRRETGREKYKDREIERDLRV